MREDGMDDLIARIPEGFTAGPWKWWTSNSWRRLKRDDPRSTRGVAEPYVCKDGHPDLSISQEDMALIALAPELAAAVRAQAARIAELEAALAFYADRSNYFGVHKGLFSRASLVTADREGDRARVALAGDRKPTCCMCGKTGLSTVEGDGGEEAEMADGRWVCSEKCYDRALASARKKDGGNDG
jgi:hypothetical protein